MKKFIHLFLFSLLHLTFGVHYPTIVWDPKNFLFACNEPKINVHLLDIISFACPTEDNQAVPPTKPVPCVNMQYLYGDIDRYKTCNATAQRRLLTCGGSSSSPKSIDIQFRTLPTGPNTLVFKAGKTYYLIGTGDGTVLGLDQDVGGQCNNSKSNEYELRLQIYVCTQKEIEEGACEVCTSPGCYYKNCGKTCSDWNTVNETHNTSGKCTKTQERFCKNKILGINKIAESKETIVPCVTKTPIQTITPTTRKSTSQTTEKKETTGQVIEPTGGPTGAARTGNENDSDLTTYVLGGALIPIALISAVVGACLNRWYHERNCLNKRMKPNKVSIGKTESTGAFANKSYQPSVSYDEYVDLGLDKTISETGDDVFVTKVK